MVRGPLDERLRAACARAADQHGWALPEPLAFLIEAPRDPALGDAATNVALTLARPLGRPPLAIAGALAEAWPDATVATVSVAPPGFLNFRLTPDFLAAALTAWRTADPAADCDRCLKLARLAADHVKEAIAAGRVPPPSAEDLEVWMVHVLARPGERLDPATMRREVLDNPWYFVRQAIDRMSSVLATAAAEGLHPATDVAGLEEPEARQLLVLVAGLEGELALAMEKRHPARLVRAAHDLATGFHRFYGTCRVFGLEKSLSEARLGLIEGARNGLRALVAPLDGSLDLK